MKKIIHANNIDYLRTLKDNSIDSVVTDPPYGLGKEPNAIEVLQSWVTVGYHEVEGKGFMGKEWDAFVPQPNFWKEIYRVLKPGGYVLSFAGTRTYDWMVMAIRLAGFEIRDMIAWVYGSGFPKSHDVSKAIDKMMGAEREIIGKHQQPAKSIYTQTNIEMSKDVNITAPKTEEAKQWDGWGTALKPALEPIVMARKPLDGTVAQNVLKHGVGGINIDGCRVGTEERTQFSGKGTNGAVYNGFPQHNAHWETVEGRFPANFIHDGSEEVEKLFPLEAGGGNSTYNFEKTNQQNTTNIITNIKSGHHFGDSGSASRFFYVAKASKEERNFGLYDFPKKQKVFNGQSDTSSTDMKDVEKRFTTQPTQNIHPTVKPIELMRYLVRMVTPPNGICLDPYLGSGTTAIACEMEKFNYIGIDRDEQYIEIAKARVAAVKDYEASLDTKTFIKESIKEDKEDELGIQTIFDFLGEE